MYEMPTDTDYADRPISGEPLMQPNTPAPIVLSSGNQYQWVSPRNIALGFGSLAILIIGAIAMRSTAISTDAPIKIAPLTQPTVSPETINQEVLDGSVDNLNKLVYLSDEKINADKLALKNERAKDITVWANKLVTDKNSDCYKSVHGRKCYLSVFIQEQAERYRDAYKLRKWKEANSILFEIESARIAWIGAVDLPLDGDTTASAIQNELNKKKSIETQSVNAQAAKAFERGGKPK